MKRYSDFALNQNAFSISLSKLLESNLHAIDIISTMLENTCVPKRLVKIPPIDGAPSISIQIAEAEPIDVKTLQFMRN